MGDLARSVGCDMDNSLARLRAEDAIGQLVHQTGRMLELGSEQGVVKLDWVTGAEELLHTDGILESITMEAARIRADGMRHIIWSGMGGSIMAVRVMCELGCFDGTGDEVAVHPLDSTDPSALNRLLLDIAGQDRERVEDSSLPHLLRDAMMIAVSMGMTSEEPITHLQWFSDLIHRAGLPLDRHALVMTLPGSYLDRFAQEHAIPVLPLDLHDGSGTGGRMSAPTTRVFLLPAAIALQNRPEEQGTLHSVLTAAWNRHDLSGALEHPSGHPYVRLAAALGDSAVNGACHMYIQAETPATALFPWIEQLMEESLGKGGSGVSVFADAPLNQNARCFQPQGSVKVSIGPDTKAPDSAAHAVPFDIGKGTAACLSALATSFLGWQLCTALFGYLHGIRFAGQPAVEEYKTRARALRTGGDSAHVLGKYVGAIANPGLTIYGPGIDRPEASPASVIARTLIDSCPSYLDLTINGEISSHARESVAIELERLGHGVLGVPVKLRRAPASYHSTEQSEMDGPPGVVSLRVLAGEYSKPVVGRYDDAFLEAQAVSTWLAMNGAGRQCYLLRLDGPFGDLSPVTAFLAGLSQLLESQASRR